MPLFPEQLAAQRARALDDMPGRCEIHRYTSVENDMGESVQTWAPVASGVPCRVIATASATGRERERLGAIAQVTDWYIVLPHNHDVTAKDRIYVTLPLPLRAFDVSQVLGPVTDETRRRALVQEVS